MIRCIARFVGIASVAGMIFCAAGCASARGGGAGAAGANRDSAPAYGD